MNDLYAKATIDMANAVVISFVIKAMLYEWLAGKYRNGKKTKEDWLMSTLGAGTVILFQRPMIVFLAFLLGTSLVPQYAGSLNWIDQAYFWPGLIIFLLTDELIHGAFHYLAHAKRPKSVFLRKVQEFYQSAHRVHHLNGANDGRGEVNIAQTFAVSWCWYLALPNYVLGASVLYFGMYKIFFWGFLTKNLWGLHQHVNWAYDLYFLNHQNSIVRKVMYGLCHILAFPTQHHQHHSRGKNSAKNVQTLFSLYDWLLWDTLAIETERPKVYGWKQKKSEEFNVFRRWWFKLPRLQLRQPARTR